MSMESDLMFLILQIVFHLRDSYDDDDDEKLAMPKATSLLIQTICLVGSTDLDSQPKPDSKFMSLLKQIISVSRSITNSERDWAVISHMNSVISLVSTNSKQEPQPELIPLVTKLFHALKSLFFYEDSKLKPFIKPIIELARFGSLGSLISISPELEVEFEDDKFRVRGKVQRKREEKLDCELNSLTVFSFTGEVHTHFHCKDCNGQYHEVCDKAPLEVKHPLHPKHSLQLVISRSHDITRKCYCCDEDLQEVFYYCSACDYAMKITCVKKSPVLSIDYPKWHEHAMVAYSRHISLTCDVCALTHSRSLFYICPPCGFAVHQSCLNLPRVIRLYHHPHQISFTPSFDQRDWSCGVCRRKIDNDYGCYSCFKKDCLYAVHSCCATQSKVWDGIDLDEISEEIEEEVPEPFVRISKEIIQHFSHQHHYLRFDENTNIDYDASKQCRACITPIYFGNIYSCTRCDFILHEKCANLSTKLHHIIHPHMLTLVGGYYGVIDYWKYCSACELPCTCGFFYKCGKEECHRFQLHVQCATISEPLVHKSHMHPLFLTSKRGEHRGCGVCKEDWPETFNCTEQCNFSLCFRCATLPHKVRYEDDKHMLTLIYGEETSIMEYWCEVCETKINPKKQFYRCDDYCCVTLHIECLIGKDLYMKPNSSFLFKGRELDVLPNSHHKARPICSYCKNRCPHNIVFQSSGIITCCIYCTLKYREAIEHKLSGMYIMANEFDN